MNALSILKLFGPELRPDATGKAQAAFFLAQYATGEHLYRFSLQRGRVRSDELDQDFLVLYVVGLAQVPNAAEAAEQAGGPSPSLLSSLRVKLQLLLKEDSDVVDAAATSVFFSEEKLGNPAARLQWFNSLPGSVLARAKQIEQETIGR